MKSLLLNGRMAFLRKVSCILVILFSLIATVFLLVYPLFIEKTRTELEYAYDSIEVTGWLFNNKGFEDPVIEDDIWHTILQTGQVKTHYSYSTIETKIYDASTLYKKSDRSASAEQLETAFKEIASEGNGDKSVQYLQALNMIEVNNELLRQANDIQWLSGYSADCLAGNENVCILSESMGYQTGALVPMRLKTADNKTMIISLQVVGVYPADLSNQLCLVLPLGTLESVFQEQNWPFYVNGFSFLVKDNRNLPTLKDTFTELGLDGSSAELSIRAAIDDRILDGTVSPIKSNLAMLEGLYKFFFVVVAAIGFFLCFLLAKGRKQEYAVMRLLGESSLQVTWKAILEQLLLCLMGIVLGTMILTVAGQGAPNLVTCGIILVCYTLGAAIAVMLTVRVNVMEILRDKE